MKAIFGTLLSFGTLLLESFFVFKLWGWYVVPLGLPVVAITQFMAIDAAIFIFFHSIKEKDIPDDVVGHVITNLYTKTVIFLFMCIVHAL